MYKPIGTWGSTINSCKKINYDTHMQQKFITDLSVIFNPVGDDFFNPFSTGPIHPFPSLPASASWKVKYHLM